MTSPAESTEYALIIERESPMPVQEIGHLLALHLPIHPADAIARVRYGGGLIVESVDCEVAERLALDLRGIGVHTRAIDTDRWLALPKGYKVCGLEFLEDALLARLPHEKSLVLLRHDVLGVHLYGLLPDFQKKQGDQPERPLWVTWMKKVTLPKKTKSLLDAVSEDLPATSTISPRGRALLDKLKEREVASMEFHLTLYCADPVGPVRMRKNDFDFSSLGAEKQAHSLDNFLLLVEKLLAYLPRAWNRKPAEEFLADLDPLKILYFKEEAAENFDRWMLQWVRIEEEERLAGGERP